MTQIEPMSKKVLVAACFAPEIVFTTENVEDLDPRIRQMIKDQDGLLCKDGALSVQCVGRCIWCTVSELGKDG